MTQILMVLGLVACGGAEVAEKHDDAHGDHAEKAKDGAHEHDHEHDGKKHAHGHEHEGDEKDHTHEHEGAATGMPELPAVPEGAKVMFVEPKDGAKVKSPVKFVFGVEGVEVEKAGEVHAGKGHHHLIIDADGTEKGTAVPADETHIHYGGGQTETEVELKPGEHTLTMQFADGLHRSYGEPLRATIKVTVEE